MRKLCYKWQKQGHSPYLQFLYGQHALSDSTAFPGVLAYSAPFGFQFFVLKAAGAISPRFIMGSH